MARAKRWSPGKGFIKLAEYGTHAIWMKPLKDGALLAAYIPGWDAVGVEHQEKWIIQLPRGSDFHWTILDKMHRIRWLLNDKPIEVGGTLWNVRVLKYERGNPSHKAIRTQLCRRMWGSWHRGHKNMWTRRLVRPWEARYFAYESRPHMPRKIEAALAPRLTQRREQQEYTRALLERWESEWAELHGHQD